MILAILFADVSVNQMLPSGPAEMPVALESGSTGCLWRLPEPRRSQPVLTGISGFSRGQNYAHWRGHLL